MMTVRVAGFKILLSQILYWRGRRGVEERRAGTKEVTRGRVGGRMGGSQHEFEALVLELMRLYRKWGSRLEPHSPDIKLATGTEYAGPHCGSAVSVARLRRQGSTRRSH